MTAVDISNKSTFCTRRRCTNGLEVRENSNSRAFNRKAAANFGWKPKLLQSVATDTAQGLVLELLEGEKKLKFQSEADLKEFMVTLLKVLHITRN